MKSTQSNKLKRYQTLNGVLVEHEDTWQSLPAFVRAVDALGAVVPQITGAAQTQLSMPDAAGEKLAARGVLGGAAHEIAAAVFSWAEENEDVQLMGRVNFSVTDILKGRDSKVIARCRDIHAAASENVDSLEDAGVTPAKLTALKKKIDAFEDLQTKPRQNVAKRSAATKAMPAMFRKADRVIGRRLDKLVVQFKDSAPDFYNAYQTARVVVDNPGARNGNGNGHDEPVPPVLKPQ